MSESHTKSHGSAGSHGEAGHGLAHVANLKMLFGVLFALLFLTWATVATAQIDLGPLNIWVAMGIATLKASLVVLFFMHMFWDKPFNQVLFIGTLVFLGLFITFCLLDTAAYRHQRDKGDGTVLQQKILQAEEAAAKPAAPGGH
ncbi:MAG: cytochrome C oxidase subunit IV family protein [Planctomycetota bacterium]